MVVNTIRLGPGYYEVYLHTVVLLDTIAFYRRGEMSEEIERDAGFCSGEDLEDPLEAEDDLHSPTDVSEDSVEVKVLPISLRSIKNKRKCAEPRKVASEDDDVLPPYKKRRHFINTEGSKKASQILQDDHPPLRSSVSSLPGAINQQSVPASPFRPWSQQTIPPPSPPQEVRRCPSTSVSTPSPPPPSCTPTHPPQVPLPRHCHSASVTALPFPASSDVSQPYNDRVPILHYQQDEPLSLVLKNESNADDDRTPQRRDRILHGPEVFASERSIHPSVTSAHASKSRFDVPGRVEDVRLCGVTGATVKGLTPVDRYALSHPRMLPERHDLIPQVLNRPIASETFVRCPSTNVNRTHRYEAVDFSVTDPADPLSVGRRTLSDCEDKNMLEVEDLSSGLRQRTCSGAKFSVESLLGRARGSKGNDEEKPGPSIASTSSNNNDQQKNKQTSQNGGQQRNYKNMTRERRIEANARERTRVHTISAAFDTLRRAIPAYSHNQKLSKLSVLRIACSYILTLSRVAGADYSADNSEPSLADCVDLVSRTIQTEGKLRRKKDE
ncbi:uncharacterized protein LOC110831035 isoform X1 [Zootermopsis nevadensis]|uniref:uncharacterized protein LOC110831035 isoform X1 n=1 Tax=Zootermopsis nevadensis TaxID=136037 RepID=UPI000B8ED971|nr:uncharacterized protein LOC110831035 isoform X1 [Zootermopsis nevadensis]